MYYVAFILSLKTSWKEIKTEEVKLFTEVLC